MMGDGRWRWRLENGNGKWEVGGVWVRRATNYEQDGDGDGEVEVEGGGCGYPSAVEKCKCTKTVNSQQIIAAIIDMDI